ncbi:outer membrane beta-barrel protein [Pontibacter sp. H249]|uniref:outer membrane beta-barrel protein n=1 Tax=Pontibacter sp. H249 TaxID=3133420 RepID=UPI0030C210E2
MRQLYLIFTFLLTLTTAYSQQDFRKGYIIQHGDTLNGYLDYRGSMKHAQAVNFKKSLTDEPKLFIPADISGYGFQKERKNYESKLIPLNDSVDTEMSQLFVTVLARGRASLYHYRDQSVVDHYYLQKDTLLVKLTQHDYKKVDAQTGKTYIFSNKKYIGSLNLAFNDCENFSASDLKYVTLSQSSLIKAVTKYNQCVSSSEESSFQQQKAKITIGPALIVGHAKLDHENKKAFNFGDDNLMGAGISVNIVVPTISEKLSLQTELQYIPYKFTGSYSKTGEFPYKYDQYYDLAYLMLPLQLRYTYPKGSFRPFVNAGFMMGYCIKNENRYIATSLRNSDYNVSLSEGNYQKLINGITAGGGISTTLKNHSVTLEARYEKNNTLSDGLHLNATVQSFSILLGYGF